MNDYYDDDDNDDDECLLVLLTVSLLVLACLFFPCIFNWNFVIVYIYKLKCCCFVFFLSSSLLLCCIQVTRVVVNTLEWDEEMKKWGRNSCALLPFLDFTQFEWMLCCEILATTKNTEKQKSQFKLRVYFRRMKYCENYYIFFPTFVQCMSMRQMMWKQILGSWKIRDRGTMKYKQFCGGNGETQNSWCDGLAWIYLT